MCPSPGVRDELTAQLLFQLHGLFENNIMSFITDNPGKWLPWQPGEKNGPDQPIRSSSRAPSLYKLSPPWGPLPSSAGGGTLEEG